MILFCMFSSTKSKIQIQKLFHQKGKCLHHENHASFSTYILQARDAECRTNAPVIDVDFIRLLLLSFPHTQSCSEALELSFWYTVAPFMNGPPGGTRTKDYDVIFGALI